MKFSITTLLSTGLQSKAFKGLSPIGVRQALNDSGQIIQNSTKVGYMKEISPEGKAWAKNPEWYKIMKGGAATLTGAASKTIARGKYSKNYKFTTINHVRMKNSLRQKIRGKEDVIIDYKMDQRFTRGGRGRDYINQFGGESTLSLTSLTTGKEEKLKIKVQARPHLGVAEKFPRLGGKTDSDHILDIFSRVVDKAL